MQIEIVWSFNKYLIIKNYNFLAVILWFKFYRAKKKVIKSKRDVLNS